MVIKSLNRVNLEVVLVKKYLKKQQKVMVVDTKRPQADLTIKTSLAGRCPFRSVLLKDGFILIKFHFIFTFIYN